MSGEDAVGDTGPDHEVAAYREAGVDYATLDAAKRAALVAARATGAAGLVAGAEFVAASRGEPAQLVSVGGVRIGVVLECLGTKSMLAGAFEEQTGEDRFAAIGYDTVAAAVNDLVCIGALPLLVNAYFATGSAGWYAGRRHASLIEGWQRACEDAGALWAGGESPTLSGLIAPDEVDLAASAVGVIPSGAPALLGDALAPGDEIVLVASSGLHANGASLARQVARRLPDRLAHRLDSGQLLGDALLAPSRSYVALVAALQGAGVPLHYASHITGHGLRKLMRARRDLTYRIAALPAVPEVLAFLVRSADLAPGEAYGTLNMGAGFACYVAAGAGRRCVEIAAELGLEALVAGAVEEGERRVVLEPLGVTYSGADLDLA